MTTRTFTIPALSPIITFEPQPDLTNSVWKSDQGGSTNGNVNSGQPARVLQGTGRVTYQTFGTGLGIRGAISGPACSYTATLEKGDGNSQDSSVIPAAQTSIPADGMLASFTGLPVDNWEIKLEAECSSGSSSMKVFGVDADAWVGNDGDTVTNSTLDDMSTSLIYSNDGIDWSSEIGLAAEFYNDTQHYSSVNGASWNLTFSGTGIAVYGSNDPMHGPFSTRLIFEGDPLDSQTPVVYNGYNPFLAVPVPIFLVTGLDPTKSYTLIIENQSTNGTYLDLDFLEVYDSNGGPPPGGKGPGIIKHPGGGGKSNMAIIIGAAVGGGVLLLLLIVLGVFLWRRRKIKVKNDPRALDGQASFMNPVIPLQGHSHGSMAAVPFTQSPYRSSPHGSHSFVGYQPVPHSASFDGGFGSPTMATHGIPGGAAAAYAPSSITGSGTGTGTGTGSYDPYAAYGGNHISHPGSIYTGTSTMVSGVAPATPTDPVMARRQGKAAEIEAARLRINNQGSMHAMSPTVTQPTTMSNTTPSIGNSSQYDISSPLHPSQYKTPDEPPPYQVQ